MRNLGCAVVAQAFKHPNKVFFLCPLEGCGRYCGYNTSLCAKVTTVCTLRPIERVLCTLTSVTYHSPSIKALNFSCARFINSSLGFPLAPVGVLLLYLSKQLIKSLDVCTGIFITSVTFVSFTKPIQYKADYI